MLIAQLHEIVLSSLDRDLFSNAVFYGERLLNESENEEFKYLLGKAYIGEGKFHKAFNVLKETKSSQCRYLFAQVCLKLNKLVEAERALLTDKHFSKNILSKELESIIPNGSAGYYLLGLITEKLANRPTDAQNAFRKALDLDPFMWCAFEKLCKFCPGKIEISKIYSELNPKILMYKKQHQNMSNIGPNYINSGNQPKDFSLSPDNMNNFNNKFGSTENKCFNMTNPNNQSTKQVNRFNLISNQSNDENDNLRMRNAQEVQPRYNNKITNINPMNNPNMTPVINKDKIDDYHNLNYNQPLVKNRDNKPFTYSSSPNGVILEFNKSSEVKSSNVSFSIDIRQKYGDSVIKPFNIQQTTGALFNSEFNSNIRNFQSDKTNTEESVPINNNIFNNIQLNENNQVYNNTVSSSSGVSLIKRQEFNFNNYNTNNQSLLNANNQQIFTKVNDLPQLLKLFSEILKAFSLYNCEEAINIIKYLPENYQNSSWCLSLLGRCYFEMAKYKECDKTFRECLKIDPARLEFLEYYSSCLWHLKDQFQLVNLASHVLEQSQFSPETWIIVGNCYSLQKEHELALKFFNRAIQICPNYAYAYTLCGHEYVENESFTQAKQCYSSAITCDDRHFNAWWGLGHIHLKEQNYSEAVKYFRKALAINEKSAILNLYLASAYQQNKELGKALVYLNNAEKLDNSNPMIKYQKANILLNNRKVDEALNILIELNERMPKEAPIHILIGRIYKLKKEFTKALSHFNTAIDIDPKDSNLAKSLIEKLYNDADDMS